MFERRKQSKTKSRRDNFKSIIKSKMPRKEDRRVLRLQCFPLYAILKAIGQVDVDFFTLDVEGLEFAIMESILEDPNDFKFSVAAVEYSHMDLWINKGNFLEFDYMMRRNGYRKDSILKHDVIYEKRNVSRAI